MQWPLLLNVRSLGLIVHLVLLYSIFDIYYSSPIIPNLRGHVITQGAAPASRLFFISADGLRLDTFLDNPEMAPFLHSLITSRKAVSGRAISHVPTESRPGHIAMLAGFTEDVSAVTRGWSRNPVPFDSIFNRSDASFLWGSEDILHLFSHTARTYSDSFSPELEDFSSRENWKLDQWVFDRVQTFLRSSSREKIDGDRRLFFLHLVGLDTNGHGHKPHSELYKQNLKVVDEGIRQLWHTAGEVFGDNRTAFLFTSDHGMTDWGSHGAGSDEEILIPLIMWGSGVAERLANREVAQIDLCPLTAALLGTAIPTNSMGVLPVFALSATPKYIFSAVYANFLQLRETIEAQLAALSSRFWRLPSSSMSSIAIQKLVEESTRLGKQSRFEAGTGLLSPQLPHLQASIMAYHRVDRPALGIAVSASFLLWLAVMVVDLNYGTVADTPILPALTWLPALGVAALLCRLSSLSLTQSLYMLLPLYLLSRLIAATPFRVSSPSALFQHASKLWLPKLNKEWPRLLAVLSFVVALALSFHDRRFVALLILAIAALPQTLRFVRCSEKIRTKLWLSLCVSALPFVLLPPAGSLPLPWLSPLPPLVAAALVRKLIRPHAAPEQLIVLDRLISGSVIVAVLIGLSTLWPCTPLRWLSWLSMPTGALVAAKTPPRSFLRLIALFASLFLPYSLVSTSYESTFLLVLSSLLLLFVRLNSSHASDELFIRVPITPSQESWPDSVLNGACAVLCFVVTSLFCAGNLASLSSFDPAAVSRLISVFSPFTMAAMLLIKLITPPLFIAITVRSSCPFGRSLSSLSSRVLIVCDLLATLFFWQLKDTGSWAAIGLSIAHYVIAMCTAVVLHLLFLAAEFLLNVPSLGSGGKKTSEDDMGIFHYAKA